jgi:putative transposase
MARAKRHFLPRHVWHLTHRCHKKEFLLKLVKDRQRWLYWLFQAKKRYFLKRPFYPQNDSGKLET